MNRVARGLQYNYFRTYNPATGRYTQSDPIGLAGGVNTFAYVSANPVNRIDPLGLFQQPAPGTPLYRALVAAGVIALSDSPEPFAMDVVAVIFLAGATTYLGVTGQMVDGPVAPELEDFNYLADEISLYTGVRPDVQIFDLTWEPFYDLVNQLYQSQVDYLQSAENQCLNPELVSRARNAVALNDQLDNVLGTPTFTDILEQQYQDYRVNGGDLNLSIDDWVALGMPGAALLPGDSGSTLFSGGTQGPRSALRQNIINDPSLGFGGLTGWLAHHIVPWQLGNHPLTTSLGMNFNDLANGIALPCTLPNDSCLSTHRGPHGNYSEAVENFLDRVHGLNISDDEKRSLVEAGIEEARQALLSGSPPLRDGDGATTQAWDNVFNRVF